MVRRCHGAAVPRCGGAACGAAVLRCYSAGVRQKRYRATLVREGSTCHIPVPFGPAEVFGKVRAPVKVTVNGYTFRSTIAAMGGPLRVPLRKSHREATGLEGGERVQVVLELDREPRQVTPPPDLVKALKAADTRDRWKALNYTHQREHVEAIEEAKKPETRARRIAKAVEMVAAAPRRPACRTSW